MKIKVIFLGSALRPREEGEYESPRLFKVGERVQLLGDLGPWGQRNGRVVKTDDHPQDNHFNQSIEVEP